MFYFHCNFLTVSCSVLKIGHRGNYTSNLDQIFVCDIEKKIYNTGNGKKVLHAIIGVQSPKGRRSIMFSFS